MTDDGFCIGVHVVGIAVVQPLIKQETEATLSHFVQQSLGQVTSQGINSYLQNETWRLIGKGK